MFHNFNYIFNKSILPNFINKSNKSMISHGFSGTFWFGPVFIENFTHESVLSNEFPERNIRNSYNNSCFIARINIIAANHSF